MGGASIWHWIVVGLIVMLLFGRGKISEMMGDVAKGIKAFKKGMADEDTATTPVAPGATTPAAPDQVKVIEHHTASASPAGSGAAAPTLGERKLG